MDQGNGGSMKEPDGLLDMWVWCVNCERPINLNRHYTHDGHTVGEFHICNGPFELLCRVPKPERFA